MGLEARQNSRALPYLVPEEEGKHRKCGGEFTPLRSYSFSYFFNINFLLRTLLSFPWIINPQVCCEKWKLPSQLKKGSPIVKSGFSFNYKRIFHFLTIKRLLNKIKSGTIKEEILWKVNFSSSWKFSWT